MKLWKRANIFLREFCMSAIKSKGIINVYFFEKKEYQSLFFFFVCKWRKKGWTEKNRPRTRGRLYTIVLLAGLFPPEFSGTRGQMHGLDCSGGSLWRRCYQCGSHNVVLVFKWSCLPFYQLATYWLDNEGIINDPIQ